MPGEMQVELNLSYKVLGDDGKENACLMLMPLRSMFLLLSLCSNEADLRKIAPLAVQLINGGESLDKICNAVKQECLSDNEMFAKFKDIIVSRNFLFVDERYRANDALLDKLKGSRLNFAHKSFSGPDDRTFLARTNALLETLTNGRIKNCIDGAMLQNPTILLNAFYIRAVWQSPMKKIGLRPFTLYSPDDRGDAVAASSVQFMSVMDRFKIQKLPDSVGSCTAIELPLVCDPTSSGHLMSMIFIVPADKTAFDKTIAHLSQQSEMQIFLDQFADGVKLLCRLTMPLFSCESKIIVPDIDGLRNISLEGPTSIRSPIIPLFNFCNAPL